MITPERLAEIRRMNRESWPIVHELLAEIDALTRDNEWRKEQMERVWPRNQYGSVLTQGEWDTAQAENARLAAEHEFLYEWFSDVFDALEHEPPHEPTLDEIKWRAAEERKERTRAQSAEFKLTADVAKLRGYARHSLTCASGKVNAVPNDWPETHSWVSAGLPCDCGLERVLAETAPGKAG